MTTNTKKDIFDKFEDFGQSIDRWFRSFGHRKAMKKIHKAMEEDPRLMTETKTKFEKAFGVNSASRSPQQWARLVSTYGMETVMKTEKLTREEVEDKMLLKFSHKIKERLN